MLYSDVVKKNIIIPKIIGNITNTYINEHGFIHINYDCDENKCNCIFGTSSETINFDQRIKVDEEREYMESCLEKLNLKICSINM